MSVTSGCHAQSSAAQQGLGGSRRVPVSLDGTALWCDHFTRFRWFALLLARQREDAVMR
jgi:hypothetical protein